jgi:nitrite reductase/ring-hydroxylating ferredoxin subunit
MATDVVLCQASDIPDGTVKHFEIMGYDIAVVNLDGTFHGLDAACTYQWANLAEGRVDRDKKLLVCKACGGSWDLKTGQPRDPPAQFPLTVYEVQRVGDDIVLTFTY